MKTRVQARRFLSRLLLLAVVVFFASAQAEEKVQYLKPGSAKFPSYTKSFNKKALQSRKFSKGFKIKGWRIGDDIYMGRAKIGGEYGPGMVVDKGSYAWGFNHQGVEFQLRF